MDDVKSWFSQPNTGTVETAAAPFWRLVQSIRPDIRTVVVRRPVAEVVESCMALNMGFDRAVMTAAMTKLDYKLDQIERRIPNVLSITFADLATEETCARVFEHCLSLPFDRDRWTAMSVTNLQSDMAATIRYAKAYLGQLTKMAKVAKHRILTDMSRGCPETEGVTFQQETFAGWYHDAQKLLAEHCYQIGEASDSHMGKNLELMDRLDRAGVMQIITARSNGRMFGYLMTVFGPSLESVGGTEALNLTFFASPDFRGLGMKLQRASAEALRKRGIDAVFLRAGVRGSGPRLGTLYRRMGAEDYGVMYKLDLKAA
jgi:GNAT superfamily N-acetyltransferase